MTRENTVKLMSTNRIGSLFAAGGVCDETLFGALPINPCAPARFRVGSQVRIQSGVFQGVEGAIVSYCSETRLIIAVDLECRGVTIEVDERMVADADA